ncbi:transcription factor [Carpediemonas membranifera]|uniref:Transcription factor n=1 Tax=Carpediemonas membranifera TaxID=201153 RepID=A0A8J6AYI6_9EUKA|nr:transcription factor [Carpediemonas membranifera]|eukprot:KAG9394575.1 transcription factor [Carpediemonas membranifera]
MGEREAVPKKPNQPYIRFTVARRPKLKEEKPELKGTEMMSTMGAEWKDMDEEARKLYVDEYNLEKEAFDKQMAAYEAKYPNWKEEEKALKEAAKEAKNGKKAPAKKAASKKETTGAIKKRSEKGAALFKLALRKMYETETGKKLTAAQVNTQWKGVSAARTVEYASLAEELNSVIEILAEEQESETESEQTETED